MYSPLRARVITPIAFEKFFFVTTPVNGFIEARNQKTPRQIKETPRPPPPPSPPYRNYILRDDNKKP